MKVLVYTRRRVKKYYHALAEQLFEGHEVVYFSDDKFCENIYIMDRFNKLIKTDLEIVDLTETDYVDIINRCRFLRSKSYNDAHKMVKTMWFVLNELIESQNVTIGLGLCVDNYVLDIYQRLLKLRDGKYISLVPTALNNYSRITERGELRRLRIVEDEEVNRALSMIVEKTYKPWYVQEGAAHIKKNLAKFYLKDKLKLIVFSVLSKLENNKYGFYYGSHFLKEPMMICNKIENCNPYIYFDYDWKLKLESKKDSKIIYMPLQFYPECSTDYWNTELYFTRYYDLLYTQLSQLEDESISILVKEHPVALGYRDVNVYKEIQKYKNIIFVPHDVPSTELIEMSHCVITGGTSTAIEAYCKGVLVLTNGVTVYDLNNYFNVITKEIMETGKLKEIIFNRIENYDEPRAFEFIRELLECSLKFNFNPLIHADENKEEIIKISEIIEQYI